MTRVARVDLDQPDTSLRSFVSEKRDELGPRRVVDIFGKTATREALHLESFDRDHVVVTYQSRARLVQMVRATTSCCRMASTHADACLAATLGAAFLPRERALRDSQAALRQACRLEAGNHRAVGKSGKGGDPEIDADRPIALAQGPGRQRGGKTNHPPLYVTPKDAGPDDRIRRHLPMEMDPKRSRHTFEPELGRVNRDALQLAQAEAIEPALAAEPGKARLAAALDPAKESFVRLVQAFQRRTLHVY